MKAKFFYTVWGDISDEVPGEIWYWSLLGVKGLNMHDCLVAYAQMPK